MCGITGFWHFDKQAIEKKVLVDMTNALSHRGPNDNGFWLNESISIGLGHRRLSILDLSQNGHQPMLSEDRRFILVFNGEIYNFRELANKSLISKGIHCDINNDTCVLLKLLIHYGIKETLPKLNGMFAFALFDSVDRKLYLARDRFGEKPLYYFNKPNSCLLFASELKSFEYHPRFSKSLCENALRLYLSYNYIPCPFSIYENTFKLFPGRYLTIYGDGTIENESYYSLETAITQRNLVKENEKECLEQLNRLINKSVQERMVSDVPIGAFLSGGIDSSLVTAIMQANSNRPIKTFTVGSKNSFYDEGHYADKIAKYLKTDHTTVYVEDSKMLDIIDNITHLYDEPFGDSSAIPTYFICKTFKKSVTVALSGDGGDELFCGYYRHIWASRLHNINKVIPLCIRKHLNYFIQKISLLRLNKCLRKVYPFLGDKIEKASKCLTTNDLLSTYLSSVTYFSLPIEKVLIEQTWFKLNPSIKTSIEQTMYLDMRTYLHDNVLCKVDRASMANGLETRTPFLDNEVVEYAWSIPVSLKFKNHTKKYLLKKLLKRYLPQNLWKRPKTGFGVPLEEWMRATLKTTIEETILEKTVLWDYIDRNNIKRLWNSHINNIQNNERYIWNIFCLQRWIQKNLT